MTEEQRRILLKRCVPSRCQSIRPLPFPSLRCAFPSVHAGQQRAPKLGVHSIGLLELLVGRVDQRQRCAQPRHPGPRGVLQAKRMRGGGTHSASAVRSCCAAASRLCARRCGAGSAAESEHGPAPEAKHRRAARCRQTREAIVPMQQATRTHHVGVAALHCHGRAHTAPRQASFLCQTQLAQSWTQRRPDASRAQGWCAGRRWTEGQRRAPLPSSRHRDSVPRLVERSDPRLKGRSAGFFVWAVCGPPPPTTTTR